MTNEPEDPGPSSPEEPDVTQAPGEDQNSPTTEGGSTSPARESHWEPSAEEASVDAPDVTTDRRSLSSRVRIVWGIRVVAGLAVLALVATVLIRRVELAPVWVGSALGALLLFLGLAWVHLRYRVWVYQVRADSLYLERGVVTHVRTIAPFVRIQHVDTQRGPLERWLGLSSLVVYTAGSRGADVSIPGLTPAEARDLQSRLKELAIEAEGGDAV